MTDYVDAIDYSVGGQMMIRDSGGVISFWIMSGNSSSWDGELGWSGTVNGSGVGGVFNYPYPGGQWRQIAAWTVSSSQTVTFTKTTDSGSMGLAGYNSMSVAINRSTIPGKTKPLGIDQVEYNSMRYRFSTGPNGGSPVTGYEVGWGTSSTTVQHSSSSTGTEIITGLVKNTKYYVWSRQKNANGWGPWSDRLDATTDDVPAAPTSKNPTSITHTGMTFDFDDPSDNGGDAITGREYQYSTSSSFSGAAVTSAPSNGTIVKTGLAPGTTYYWRARVKNSAGTGPWSTTRSASTLAGARVRVGGVWKLAIPYVRVAGVWKAAVPYVRVSGSWKAAG